MNDFIKKLSKYIQKLSIDPDAGFAERAIQKKLDEGDIKGAKTLAKAGLTGQMAGLATSAIPFIGGDIAGLMSTTGGKQILKKAAIDLAGSLAIGESVNKVGQKLTGQPTTGRFTITSLFGNKGGNWYDRHPIGAMISDIITNPGYAIGGGIANSLMPRKLTINPTLRKAYNSPNTKVIFNGIPAEAIMASDNLPAPRILKHEDLLFNRPTFKNASSSDQKKLLEAIKRRGFPKKEDIRLFIQDQGIGQIPTRDIEKTLQDVWSKANEQSLPINIVQRNDGTYVMLQGNLEELLRQHHGIDNGLININTNPLYRAHHISGINGVNPNNPKEMFFAGTADNNLISDPGIVFPYVYSGKVLKQLTAQKPERYLMINNLLNKFRSSKIVEIENYFKSGNFEKAADSYLELQSIPEVYKPWMQDRMIRIVPNGQSQNLSEATRREALSILKSSAIFKPNAQIELSKIPTSKVLDFSDSRHSIFSGNPEVLNNYIIGQYYLKPNARIATPNLSMRQWKGTGKLSTDIINNAISAYGIEPFTDSVIKTDKIGKAFNDKGMSVLYHARDFNHPGVDYNWSGPQLFMSSQENLPEQVYRTDRYRIGLKNGGRIQKQ